MKTDRANQTKDLGGSVFKFKAALALGISISADALDYFAAPFFGLPVVGDIFDAIIISILFGITRSKISTGINMIEFIPLIGDYIPVYTMSTLLWVSKEWNNQKKLKRRQNARG